MAICDRWCKLTIVPHAAFDHKLKYKYTQYTMDFIGPEGVL